MNHNHSTLAVDELPDVPSVPLLSDDGCWVRLPRAVQGAGQPLPNWAKAVAVQLPQTAAAMLELDLAHRTRSPLDPILWAKMRWVIARANRCGYSEAYALADARRAGMSEAAIRILTGDPIAWPEADRDPLEFARLHSLAAPTITDAHFVRLRASWSDPQVAAMVLLGAYGNFQDRIVLGLNLPVEAGGPLPPVEVKFADGSFQAIPLSPPQAAGSLPVEAGAMVVDQDREWSDLSHDELQRRLEQQRGRTPRLPVPAWDDIKSNLPPAFASQPTRIVWSLICYGYIPELAIPWSITTRTMGAEALGDRVFEESLFWVQTRAVHCNYCMGHCEMLLEVAGLSHEAIAERTKLLAGHDWSTFPVAEQHAFAFARKLSTVPWALTPTDYNDLAQQLGARAALATFFWLCRGLYMTRISDGFQLPLESDNVFRDYYYQVATKVD